MAKRSDLVDPTGPAHTTPQQRLGQVAAVLAAGVLRMRERRQNPQSYRPGSPISLNPTKLRLSFPAEVALMACVVTAFRERSSQRLRWVFDRGT